MTTKERLLIQFGKPLVQGVIGDSIYRSIYWLCERIDELRFENARLGRQLAELRAEVRESQYPPANDDSPLQRAFEVTREMEER